MIKNKRWREYIPHISSFEKIVTNILNRKTHIIYVINSDCGNMINDNNFCLTFDRIYKLDIGSYRVIFNINCDVGDIDCNLYLEFIDKENRTYKHPLEKFQWNGDSKDKESSKRLTDMAFKVTSFIREQIKNIRRIENEKGM